MKAELKKSFDQYLQIFEQDETICNSFKKLILEQLGLGAELDPIIDEYIKIAKLHKYAYALPLGYAMKFFTTYGSDIDLAIAYNEKARKLFMELPDYKENDGILTVANNAVISNIIKENYGAAYEEILTAMPLAEKNGQISYYSAFLNNGAIILREFGLYKKAIQQVEETLEKRDLIGDSNFFITVFLLDSLYLYAGETDKVRYLLDMYLPEMVKMNYYEKNIFLKQYMEAAVIDDKKEEAEKYYNEIIQSYKFEENDRLDNLEVYLSLARYHVYRKDYAKALVYYEKMISDIDHSLGHKRQIFEEIGQLYAHLNDYKQAYYYMKQAHDLSIAYTAFIDDMYRKEIDDVWEKNRMLSYEVMYDRLIDMTEFGKVVTSCLDQEHLVEVIDTRAGRIFSFDHWELLLYDELHQQFVSLNKSNYSCNQYPILAACMKATEPMKFANLTAEPEIQKSLGPLCDRDTNSMLLQQVFYQGKIQAIFCMKSGMIENFSRADVRLLKVFADYLAIAIHNVQQFSDAVEKSSYDYLCGIYNRSALMQYGEKMIQTAREKRSSIGIMMMDIDNFKLINDTYGHMKGDDVIRSLTAILKENQGHDIIARFGGEEFILLADQISKAEIYNLAEKIRYQCEECRISSEQGIIHFTISIGCIHEENSVSSLQELFDEVDKKLYVAKRNGKNCVQM